MATRLCTCSRRKTGVDAGRNLREPDYFCIWSHRTGIDDTKFFKIDPTKIFIGFVVRKKETSQEVGHRFLRIVNTTCEYIHSCLISSQIFLKAYIGMVGGLSNKSCLLR
jgi:hypothetical protein